MPTKSKHHRRRALSEEDVFDLKALLATDKEQEPQPSSSTRKVSFGPTTIIIIENREDIAEADRVHHEYIASIMLSLQQVSISNNSNMLSNIDYDNETPINDTTTTLRDKSKSLYISNLDAAEDNLDNDEDLPFAIAGYIDNYPAVEGPIWDFINADKSI